MRAAFTGDDMGGFVGENFVAGPAMHQRRGNVAHGARRQEHRGLLAEQIGHPLAQQVHGRIVADLLVADFGPRDRLAHGRRRAGLGIRQQVDPDRRRIRVARRRGIGHDQVSSLTSSWPGSSRPPMSCCLSSIIKTWMPRTKPGHDETKGPGKTGALISRKRQFKKSTRIEFDDQMRLHLHRERHVGQSGDAGELRRHLAVIDFEEVGHVTLRELAGFQNDGELF